MKTINIQARFTTRPIQLEYTVEGLNEKQFEEWKKIEEKIRECQEEAFIECIFKAIKYFDENKELPEIKDLVDKVIWQRLKI
jgi:hypothetical protein